VQAIWRFARPFEVNKSILLRHESLGNHQFSQEKESIFPRERTDTHGIEDGRLPNPKASAHLAAEEAGSRQQQLLQCSANSKMEVGS
jgi:hypothetical protein